MSAPGVPEWEARPDETPTIQGLSALASGYEAILCDVWGVLIDGARHFPAAAAALREFRAGGGTAVLITNASRPSEEVRGQLERLGLQRDCYDDIVSAGELTLREIVARKGAACHHLGPRRDIGLFEAAGRLLGAPLRLVGPLDADYVVCTGLIDEDRETPEDYDGRLRRLRERDLVMLCANPDIVVEVGDRLYWCAGALAQRYAAMGGEVKMFGKPHAPIYEAALARVEALRRARIGRGRVLAIGDGADTDLRGAGVAGVDCLFVTRGVHREELYGEGEELDRGALARLFARAKTKPVALAREVVW
ncbi:MAG: TIGR01459 family HAD-type hydrolase [Methylocystis sp.]